jgi:uncharacterized membrane protein
MSATQVEGIPGAGVGGDLGLVLPGRTLPAGEGWTWIANGWGLFTRAPLMWIVSILLVFVAAIVIGLVPFIGSIAFQILNATISAGFVVACRSLERGGEFELEHLFAGFKTQFGNLVIVGLLLLAGYIVIFLVFAGIAGFSILGAILAGHSQDAAQAILASAMTIVLGTLVALALMMPLLAAYWFAPALVVMHGLSPVAAMKASFFACFRNFVPFLVYSIVMMVFAILAVIPFGLGFFVWIPLAIASTYASYRAIFTEETVPTQPAAT